MKSFDNLFSKDFRFSSDVCMYVVGGMFVASVIRLSPPRLIYMVLLYYFYSRTCLWREMKFLGGVGKDFY